MFYLLQLGIIFRPFLSYCTSSQMLFFVHNTTSKCQNENHKPCKRNRRLLQELNIAVKLKLMCLGTNTNKSEAITRVEHRGETQANVSRHKQKQIHLHGGLFVHLHLWSFIYWYIYLLTSSEKKTWTISGGWISPIQHGCYLLQKIIFSTQTLR